ncbi:flavin-dependent L-tryptophan oxidase RebO-like [Mytilus californianus]|uniref:flavin-dependent L-tryptophan oxidase RebO-like n=1 Tax=Mytilus californianus TaxID=6549 RepID=UPI002246F249|nr:flavin-dependent L-tryptophan oxidase RebO-like [Mytilus californianus]
MTIVNKDLKSAYMKYGRNVCAEKKGIEERDTGKSVLIVGAGLSGLSAAFELEKVGYNTQILELQPRVGGRTQTLRDEFSAGLHAEGGAMRIPPNHYLTNVYIEKFGILVRPFCSYTGNTWILIDEHEKIKTKDWKEKNRMYSTKCFPGWDSNLPANIRPSVDGILDLYERTMQPVIKELFSLINEKEPHVGWNEWVEKWSKLSVEEFLRTNGDSIYRPWPEEAIRGLRVATYSPAFGTSLVEHLRDELSKWWANDLQTPVDGMDTIAKNFIKPQFGTKEKTIDLSKKITFGSKVRTVKRISENNVEITARNVITGTDRTYTANAVILTVPLAILRQIEGDIPEHQRSVLKNIHYRSSTKVVLQCKSRFWEKQVGQVGFLKTNLPIGQLHYPSHNDPPPPNERGLLVVYIWEQDAIIFGSQPHAEAIDSAVREITKIHPEMESEFEVGMVQAWFSDNAEQGAHSCLQPYQYNNGMKTLMKPEHPIYLAGEAISYSNGWIQGAIESGLTAAYHLYCHNQH